MGKRVLFGRFDFVFEPKVASSFAPWLADPQHRLYWSIVDWLHCWTFSEVVRRQFGQDFGCRLQCALRVRTRFINFTMMNSMTGYSDWEKKTGTERSTSVKLVREFLYTKNALPRLDHIVMEFSGIVHDTSGLVVCRYERAICTRTSCFGWFGKRVAFPPSRHSTLECAKSK